MILRGDVIYGCTRQHDVVLVVCGVLCDEVVDAITTYLYIVNAATITYDTIQFDGIISQSINTE